MRNQGPSLILPAPACSDGSDKFDHEEVIRTFSPGMLGWKPRVSGSICCHIVPNSYGMVPFLPKRHCNKACVFGSGFWNMYSSKSKPFFIELNNVRYRSAKLKSTISSLMRSST